MLPGWSSFFGRRRPCRINRRSMAEMVFKLCASVAAMLCGLAFYQRTINMWTLKNLGDAFLTKDIGSRIIILGTFLREATELNLSGTFAVIHFLGDGRLPHDLYCISNGGENSPFVSSAHIQRINQGKRAANDICSWAGHLAECEIRPDQSGSFRLGVTADSADALVLQPPPPQSSKKKHDLVVCVAPMYIYTDWEIMLTGIETWLALGATKIIIPIQSASTTTYRILQAYEKEGLVVIRHWPKWPVLSDTNPNGLVLSRGIEESHVNCLFYVKPFADMVVFTDIDDMLLPVDPQTAAPGGNVQILKSLFAEHPQAGSLLFEHRDTQLRLPSQEAAANSLAEFNFDFLDGSRSKQNCQVWRMKTRVVVKAGRVDSVNMHETGIHRLGFVQTRVPCRLGHFYHLRHSHSFVADPAAISLQPLAKLLNKEWSSRVSSTFSALSSAPLNRSSTESFVDFDRCMSAINEEHWTLRVSRCLTPHVCFSRLQRYPIHGRPLTARLSRLQRDVECVAARADYSFHRTSSVAGGGPASGAFLITAHNLSLVPSDTNCEAPVPKFTSGDHFFAP